MPQYKVYYFEVYHGRASAIKCQLAHAKADWEDVGVSKAQWPVLKPRFGSLPVVKLEDGAILKESIPISRYLATQLG